MHCLKCTLVFVFWGFGKKANSEAFFYVGNIQIRATCLIDVLSEERCFVFFLTFSSVQSKRVHIACTSNNQINVACDYPVISAYMYETSWFFIIYLSELVMLEKV